MARAAAETVAAPPAKLLRQDLLSVESGERTHIAAHQFHVLRDVQQTLSKATSYCNQKNLPPKA